jgi:CIC family chloride channel protein
MWWPAIGGVVVGVGGLVYPRALGVGYDLIQDLLRGNLAVPALLLLLVTKWTMWSASLGSGTSGGVLAPLLIMGAAVGGLESHWFPDEGLGFWPLVSMGAVLGGTMRSPFTGVIFTLELTHDLDALLPLLLAVTCAHAFTVLVLRRSILTEKVSRRGFHLSREYSTDPLEILFVREVMGSEIAAIPASLNRDQIIASIGGKRRGHRIFAVVDEVGAMLGVVTRRDMAQWALQQPTREAQTLASIARKAVTAFPDEPLRIVVNRMAETGRTVLPVVSREDPRKLVGLIALRDLLKARVRHIEEERRRERILPISLVVPRWLRSIPSIPASGRLPPPSQSAPVEPRDR